MNRWCRIVLALSVAATVVWISGGWVGYQVRSDSTLARHTLLVFGALLALLLTHGWVGIYLVTLERLLRRRADLGPDVHSALARSRRWGVSGAALGVTAPLAQFLSGNALYPGRLDAQWHAVGGLLSAVALTVTLALEWRALRRVSRVSEGLSD